MGAKLVNEVASKTSDVAGDGTTTATVLAEAIFSAGLKNITAGANPTAVKRGIDAAVEVAVKSIKDQSVKVRGKDDIAKVATISANGDQEVGKMLSEAFEKVGKDRRHRDEEGRASEHLGAVEGMQFDKGYVSPYFITNPTTLETVARERTFSFMRRKSPRARPIPVLEKMRMSASRCSSSPRTSRAKPWRPWWSTSSAACCTPVPSRLPASAIAAKPCWATSRS